MPQMLKIWAYDRPGVLSRIAGLIRRKGWDIHTLMAADVDGGLAQIDIALLGRNLDMRALGKYLMETDLIEKFEECTQKSHVLREMLLFCLPKEESEPAGLPKEALEKIRRARLVEECGQNRYLEISGTPGEAEELAQILYKHNIPCARTGALALSRADILTDKGADADA